MKVKMYNNVIDDNSNFFAETNGIFEIAKALARESGVGIFVDEEIRSNTVQYYICYDADDKAACDAVDTICFVVRRMLQALEVGGSVVSLPDEYKELVKYDPTPVTVTIDALVKKACGVFDAPCTVAHIRDALEFLLFTRLQGGTVTLRYDDLQDVMQFCEYINQIFFDVRHAGNPL